MTSEHQPEARKEGKPMSFMDIAARMAPLGVLAVGALGVAENRRQDRRARREFQNMEDELLRNDWRANYERTDQVLRAQRQEASERYAGIVEAQNAAEALGIEYRQLQREMREMERAAAIMGEELLVGNPRRVMAGLVARAATPTQLFTGRAQTVSDWQEGALARGDL